MRLKGKVLPPLQYRKIDASVGHIEDPGGWSTPEWTWDTDTTILEWSWTQDYEDDRWVHLGWAPKPKTKWQKIKRHFCHGIIMGYPLKDVLFWVIRHDIMKRD